MSHFVDYLMASGWAMAPEHAEHFRASLQEIMSSDSKIDMEVLESYKAKYAENGERLKVRDGVGILYVEGPLFKKANFMTAFCGATSYETLIKDHQAALDDPSIHSIAMMIDSPGGEANGCDEVANAIFNARGKKPITAFVSGMAASGGYWIASAADKIVVSDAAILGSIGVVLGVQDRSEAEAKRGVKTVQFVSSQSPGKRPDPNTEEGKSRIQTMVNDLADVFVSAVARNRKVTAETVIKEFGAGGVEIGKKAVSLKMADEVGSFEGVVASLNKRGNQGRSTRLGGFTVSEDNTNGPSAAEIAEKAGKDAQTRIKAITTATAAAGLAGLAAHLAFDTQISAEGAVKIMEAASADLEAAKPKIEEDKPDPNAGERYATHRAEAGGLGLGKPDASTEEQRAAKVKSSWSAAVKDANSGLGL